MAEPVISVAGLRKSYGELEAVRGIDLEVGRGRDLRLPGAERRRQDDHGRDPRGLPRPQRRRGQRARHRPARARTAHWRERIGFVLQECRHASRAHACASRSSSTPATTAARAASTRRSTLVGLGEKADARAARLSGGQQRRLDVALALIGDPELLFLDEPTTGFDPSARRQAWDVIASLRDLGKTVFLTTHYMDEAQALADRVAIIAAARSSPRARPSELGGRDGAAPEISFRLPAGVGRRRPPAEIAVRGARPTERRGRALRADDPVAVLQRAHGWALRARGRAGGARGQAAEPRGRLPRADRGDG